MQAHFGAHGLRPLHEVGCAHPGLDGREGMLDGLTPGRHGLDSFHAGCHGFDDALVLPTFYAALLAGRALVFHQASWARGAPINGHGEIAFLGVEAARQAFAGRTAIAVLIRPINKRLLAEAGRPPWRWKCWLGARER